MRDPFRIDRPAQISFSGGRTSGLLLRRILDAFGGELPPDVYVTFANTGKEREETLAFVDECQRRWGVPIRWLEYVWDRSKPVVAYKGKQPVIGCHGWREVTFESASRRGEPFEDIVAVKAAYRLEAKNAPPTLPNPVQRFCTGELKKRVMAKFLKSVGVEAYTVAVGIRADEMRRVAGLKAQRDSSDIDYVCPLADAGLVLKDVMDFWAAQDFDLGLEHDPVLGTYEGNCTACFLKKSSKIKRIAAEMPEDIHWWADMERKTGARFRKDRFSYVDLVEGRVPLEVVPAEAACEDETTCFCHD